MESKERTRPEKIFLPIFFYIAMVSFTVWAANETTQLQIYKMAEIVVTANRAKTPEQEIAANITVITRDDVKKMPVSNVAELLQYVPGVYVEFNGGLGSQATVRIQGSDIRHVAIYQDGVPLNQLANPQTDLSYLPVDMIERVEIYKGAASSAWGSSLGGVINIITRDPDPKKPTRVDMRTSYGEFKTSKSRGTLSVAKDRFGFLLSLTHDESGGFMEHTEYKQDAVYAKINYELGETSRVNVVSFYDEGRNEDPIIDFPAFWDDNYRRRTYQRLLFETSPDDDLMFSLEGRHHRFYNKIEDVFSDHRETFSDYRDEILGISGRMTWDTGPFNSLNLGYDGDWGSYDWKNYDREYETRNWAIHVNDTLTRGDVSFNGGVRYDDNKDFGSEISPSGGMVYRGLGEKALFRGQVAKGFSAPPAAWVHDPQFGNPDLDPEVGINYQLGSEIQPFPSLKLELNLFRSDIKDLIRYNPDTRKFENIDEVQRQGVEGSISISFDFGLALSYGGSYVDVRNAKTDHVIEDIPRTQHKLSASYTTEWMTHSIVGKYIDHNSSYPETSDQVFIFDYLLKARLPLPERYGKLNLYGAVYNLSNTTYLYREVFPQPDRWIEGGVLFEF